MRGVNRLLTHQQSVRLLYRSVLRLHRALPADMRALGDQYAKDEFRRHKQASPEETAVFMTNWAEYVQQLHRQLSAAVNTSSTAPLINTVHQQLTKRLGVHLSQQQLDQLADHQVLQLHELLKEVQSSGSGQAVGAGEGEGSHESH